MNYESFFSEYQNSEKSMKEILAAQQKLFKRLSKNMEKGDLKNAAKDLAALTNAANESAKLINLIDEYIEGFDAAAYLESGDFAKQMSELCAASGIDVKGEGFIYEVFPYKVKIDVKDLDVYIDRKRLQYLRPEAFVNELKNSRGKLMNAAFSPSAFASELAGIYDNVIKLKSADNKTVHPQSDLYLTDLYKYLTPMRRFRKDYDLQNFAFDLARLYASDFDRLDDGRKFQFGPSRTASKSIRVLDAEGREQYLATIRFYMP